MKKTIAILATLALLLAALTPAFAEGAIKRVGTLRMLNMAEQDYAAVQKLRAVAGTMLNEDGVAAENPYYDGMMDENLEIVYFDSLNEMVMALDADQIDAIDLNRSTADYLCANNEGLKILMDYDDSENNILTDFVFGSLLSFDYSLMLPAEKQELADEFSKVLVGMEEDGTLDTLAETYIESDMSGDIPAAEMPVIEGAETIRVAVTGDLPPMDYVSPDGQPAGFNVAVLAELSARTGKNIELIPISADARSIAIASDKVDVVFWSRSCVSIAQMIEENLSWREFFEPEDEEDEAMLDKIDEILVPSFDSVGYSQKDIPEGMITTERYYSDCIVLVSKE